MTDLSGFGCLTFDYGNYLAISERLGRPDGFGRNFYYAPYVYNGFPDHRPIEIGRNVPNLVRVKEWAEVIDAVDIIIFPDSHEPKLQEYFRSIGKKVFGSFMGCELEHDRKKTKEIMKELGLPLNNYQVAYGMDELESILKEKEDVYVKSSLRGDMETFHHENYLLSRSELKRMRQDLGTYENKETYIIEDPIESVAEIGIDSFIVDGRHPQFQLSGIELKDTGYYGCISNYADLPSQLTQVTDSFAKIFEEIGYRGFYSNEVIISKDKKGYLLDTCARAPQPPSDLMLEIYSNFPEIVWQVANGFVPHIEYKYKHGVQFIIKSDIAKTETSPLIIPEEYKNFVKVKNLVIDDDGTYYYQPMGVPMCEIGSVVGLGDSMNEAVKMAKKISESIKGFDIKINTDCISKAKEQINNLRKAGINYLT